MGGPAFLIGGTHWRTASTGDEAVARFRAAGPAAAASRPPACPCPASTATGPPAGRGCRSSTTDRDYTPVTHRIVTRHGCGIREEQFFLVQHLEYYDRCGERLVAYGTDIAFWWTHGTQDFACTGGSFDGAGLRAGGAGRVGVRRRGHPGPRRPPSTWATRRSRSTGGRSRPATPGGRRSSTGATKGAAVVDDWFDLDTGLVLRETRNIGLRVGSPVRRRPLLHRRVRVRPAVHHARPLTEWI